MTLRPLDGEVSSGAGSRLQIPKSSSSRAVSRTPVSSNCLCLMKVVRTRCMVFLPISLFIPGLLPLSPVHHFRRVESACASFVRIASHRQRCIAVHYLYDRCRE